MPEPAKPPLSSLDALAAQSERADQGRLALKRELAQRTVTARDQHGVVEVTVDTNGAALEVALNATVVHRVDPKTLASSILQAMQNAQRDAKKLVERLREYHLGRAEGR